MRAKSAAGRFSLALAALGLCFLFQNCTQANSIKSTSAASKAKQGQELVLTWPGEAEFGGGTGNGYDGKVFVSVDERRPCADGSHVQAAIYLEDQPQKPVAYLIREQCQNIAATVLRQDEVVVLPGGQVEYKGQSFTDRSELKAAQISAKPLTSVTCTQPLEPTSRLRVSISPDGVQLKGYVTLTDVYGSQLQSDALLLVQPGPVNGVSRFNDSLLQFQLSVSIWDANPSPGNWLALQLPMFDSRLGGYKMVSQQFQNLACQQE